MVSNSTHCTLVVKMVLATIFFLCLTDALGATATEIEKFGKQVEEVELKDHLEEEGEVLWSIDIDEDDATSLSMHQSPFMIKCYLSEQKCATLLFGYSDIVQPPPER